jgi:hypothetical protein
MKFCDLLETFPQWILAPVCAVLLFISSAHAENGGALINKGADNVAIGGYDTVAYFTEGRAVKGKSEFEVVWNDVRWHFSKVSHRDLFADTPERYAPQFGGLCAGAVIRGVAVKADPEVWTIVDGKLYMKVNKGARDEWRENATENVKKGNEAWPAMKRAQNSQSR